MIWTKISEYGNIILVINLNNRKIVLIVMLFIALFMIGAVSLGIAEHIPFLGKALTLIIAAAIILFVLVFFVLVNRRKK